MAILMFVMRRSSLSPAEYFLLNLMVTSLLFIIVSTPMVAISSLHHRWMFGESGECRPSIPSATPDKVRNLLSCVGK
ncbi:Melanopsin [Amphibalanus amphitrite]|uniref:Melanopsin n=1 Tax=Amphibalanus amphitrite TaxID=1232801 RepID=A0A6A4WIS7_AMPAM|nr:Melanopsin [Amphibalanus amphitrite]